MAWDMSEGAVYGRGTLGIALLLAVVAVAMALGCAGSAVTAPEAERDDSTADFEPDRLIAGVGTGLYKPLNLPEFVTADAVVFLEDPDIVLGLSADGEHRAYPIRQAAFHHIINDMIVGVPYLITY